MCNVERKSGLRRIDVVAVIGLMALGIGAALFKFGADYLPAWLAWLIAPLLWYVGVGMLVGWACGRMFGSMKRPEIVTQPDAAKPGTAATYASNFVEHDFELDHVKETA